MNRAMVLYFTGRIIKVEAALLMLPFVVALGYKEKTAVFFLIAAALALSDVYKRQLVIGIRAYEIAIVLAFLIGYHSNCLAALEKGVDSGCGIFGNIGNYDLSTLCACEIGSLVFKVSKTVFIIHKLAADSLNSLIIGGLCNRDHIKAAGLVKSCLLYTSRCV